MKIADPAVYHESSVPLIDWDSFVAVVGVVIAAAVAATFVIFEVVLVVRPIASPIVFAFLLQEESLLIQETK